MTSIGLSVHSTYWVLYGPPLVVARLIAELHAAHKHSHQMPLPKHWKNTCDIPSSIFQHYTPHYALQPVLMIDPKSLNHLYQVHDLSIVI